jgi:hypothetical protein
MWYKKTLVSVFSLWAVVGYASENTSVSVSTETLQQSSSTIQNNNSRTGCPTNNVPITGINFIGQQPVVPEVNIPVNSINSSEPETLFDRLNKNVISFCGPKIKVAIQKIDVLVGSMPWGLGWIRDSCSIESEFLDYCLALMVLFAYVNQSKNTNLYAVLFGIRYVYKNTVRAHERHIKDLETKRLSEEIEGQSKNALDKLLEDNKQLRLLSEEKEKILDILRRKIEDDRKSLEKLISERKIAQSDFACICNSLKTNQAIYQRNIKRMQELL